MTAESEYHSNFAEARKMAADQLGRPTNSAAGQHHLFDRLDWFESLHTGVLSHHQPLLAHAQQGGDGLWLMLMRDGQTALSMAYWYSFAWRPIWTGQPDTATKLALATEMLKGLRRHVAKLALSPVPEEDGSAALLNQAMRQAGWTVDAKATSHNHWLETGGRPFADWWAERPGALRSTVKRKGNKGLVALEIHKSFDDALWNEFEAVYRESWKPPESHPDFLRAWARSEGEAGTLRLAIARVEGQAVAAQFWSTDDGVAYIHKLSHVAGHDALSPGTLLTHALFAQAFDEDHVSRIDFGTGDDGYKRDWMEQSAPLLTLTGWDKRQPAAWPSLAKSFATRLAARVRAR
jgi:hypothetical protein